MRSIRNNKHTMFFLLEACISALSVLLRLPSGSIKVHKWTEVCLSLLISAGLSAPELVPQWWRTSGWGPEWSSPGLTLWSSDAALATGLTGPAMYFIECFCLAETGPWSVVIYLFNGFLPCFLRKTSTKWLAAKFETNPHIEIHSSLQL